jgi:hypothetical protein
MRAAQVILNARSFLFFVASGREASDEAGLPSNGRME